MQVIETQKTVRVVLEISEEEQKQLDDILNELYTKHINDSRFNVLWEMKAALSYSMQ